MTTGAGAGVFELVNAFPNPSFEAYGTNITVWESLSVRPRGIQLWQSNNIPLYPLSAGETPPIPLRVGRHGGCVTIAGGDHRAA